MVRLTDEELRRPAEWSRLARASAVASVCLVWQCSGSEFSDTQGASGQPSGAAGRGGSSGSKAGAAGAGGGSGSGGVQGKGGTSGAGMGGSVVDASADSPSAGGSRGLGGNAGGSGKGGAAGGVSGSGGGVGNGGAGGGAGKGGTGGTLGGGGTGGLPPCSAGPAQTCLDCCRGRHSAGYSEFLGAFYECGCGTCYNVCSPAYCEGSPQTVVLACMACMSQNRATPTFCTNDVSQCSSVNCAAFMNCAFSCQYS